MFFPHTTMQPLLLFHSEMLAATQSIPYDEFIMKICEFKIICVGNEEQRHT